MFKLTVDQILASIEALSAEEKEALQTRLPSILQNSNAGETSQQGQFMDNQVGDIQISGNSANFNFQPIQAGGDVNLSNQLTQGSSGQKELLNALSVLKASIQNAENLPELSKVGAKTQVDKITAEVQQKNPDKNLIGQTITALKQGLKGVQELAGPTAAVASIVAKVWGIPIP